MRFRLRVLTLLAAVVAVLYADDAVVAAVNDETIVIDDDVIVLDDDESEETVLVVRHRAATPLSPSSRVIKAAEFQGRFADLPSVLETVSGIDIRSTGGYGQYAESSIRGGSAKGLRIYLDGILLTSAAAGAVDLGKLPLDKIREIRVTKNTSGLRRMGAGMGGVIELFTDGSGGGNNIAGVNVEAGSFGYLKGGALIGRGRHQFNIDISTSDNDYPFTHDNGTTLPTGRDPDPTWDDTLMRKRNNHYRSIDAAYGFRVNISDSHRITQRLGAGAFEQGLFVYHYREEQSGSTGGASVVYGIDYLGELTPRLTIGGEASGIYRHGNISDPDGRFSLGAAGKELASDGGTVDALIDARYAVTDNLHLSGLTGMRHERYRQQNRALDERPAMGRYEYRVGAEALFRAGVNNSAATESALRFVYKYETDTSTAGLGYWSSAGNRHSLGYPATEAVFRVSMTPVSVQLSASASKRSPTFFERFGWSSGFLSNPDLREETRMEADMGISIDMGEWSAATSVFAGRVSDKIKSVPQNGFVKVMNFANTGFYGAEADFNAKLFQMLTVELSASYLNSVIAGAADPGWIGKIEPFIPVLSGFVKTEIDWRRVGVGHGIKYEGECYLSIENGARKSSQTELSAWASYRVIDRLTLRYRVANYANTASFDFLDNPRPRRTHAVSASFNY